MVVSNFDFDSHFVKAYGHIKDPVFKEKVEKQITKIINNPEVGKPMRYARKGTREVYIKPFRLSYFYSREEDKVTILALYHKDEQ